MIWGMRLSGLRKAEPSPVMAEEPRPTSVSPDDLVRLSEQRLQLSLEVRPIRTADLDLAEPLVPQIRELLARRLSEQ